MTVVEPDLLNEDDALGEYASTIPAPPPDVCECCVFSGYNPYCVVCGEEQTIRIDQSIVDAAMAEAL